jgi:hypothetical protein
LKLKKFTRFILNFLLCYLLIIIVEKNKKNTIDTFEFYYVKKNTFFYMSMVIRTHLRGNDRRPRTYSKRYYINLHKTNFKTS